MTTDASEVDEATPLLNPPNVEKDIKFHQCVLPLSVFVLIFYLSYTGSGTLIPQYIQERNNERTNDSDNACLLNKSQQSHAATQSKSSAIIAAADFFGGIPNILTVFFYGVLSDKFGRKLVIFITLCGLLLYSIAISIFINLNYSYAIYFAANFIQGISGSAPANIAAMFALVVDNVPNKKYGISIAIVESAAGVGALLASLLNGWLIPTFGYGVTVIVFTCICGLNYATIFFIKESKDRANISKRTHQENSSMTVAVTSTLKEMLSGIRSLILINGKRTFCLVLILISLTIINIDVAGIGSVTTLYLKDAPFCWTSANVGNFNALYIGLSIAGGFGALLFIKDRISFANYIFISLLSRILNNISMGLASLFQQRPMNSILAIAAPCLGIMGGLASIIIRAISARLVEENERGAVFGFLAIGDAASSLGSPFTTSIYSLSVGFLRGFTYFLSAGLLVIAMILMTIVRITSNALQIRRSTQNHAN